MGSTFNYYFNVIGNILVTSKAIRLIFQSSFPIKLISYSLSTQLIFKIIIKHPLISRIVISKVVYRVLMVITRIVRSCVALNIQTIRFILREIETKSQRENSFHANNFSDISHCPEHISSKRSTI